MIEGSNERKNSYVGDEGYLFMLLLLNFMIEMLLRYEWSDFSFAGSLLTGLKG